MASDQPASWAVGAWGSAASVADTSWAAAVEPVAAWGAQPSSGFGGAPAFGFSGGDPLAAFTSANRPVSFSSFVPGTAAPDPTPATTPAEVHSGPVSMLISPAPRSGRLVPPSSGPPTAGGKRRRAEAGTDADRGDATPEEREEREEESGAPTGPGLPVASADGGAGDDGSVDAYTEAGADEGGAGNGDERAEGTTPTRQHEQAFDAPTVTFEAAPGAVLANGEEGEFTVLQARVKVYIRAPLLPVPATATSAPTAAAASSAPADAADPASGHLPQVGGGEPTPPVSRVAGDSAAEVPLPGKASVVGGAAQGGGASAASSDYLALTSVPLLGRSSGAAGAEAPSSIAAVVAAAADESSEAAAAGAASAAPAASAAAWRWRECGAGPLRLNLRRDAVAPGTASVFLSAATGAGASTVVTLGPRAQPYAPAADAGPLTGPAARLVIRQEHHRGGPGKRLLVNAPLWPGLPVSRHPVDERALQIVLVNAAPASLPADSSAAGGAVTGAVPPASSEGGRPTASHDTFLLRADSAEIARRLFDAIQSHRTASVV